MYHCTVYPPSPVLLLLSCDPLRVLAFDYKFLFLAWNERAKEISKLLTSTQSRLKRDYKRQPVNIFEFAFVPKRRLTLDDTADS